VLKQPGFSLVVNAPHREYREHLHGAKAVLLPIEPCDEPAGLTAALEAVACGVPVLANRSMGICALFEVCDYPLPVVGDLSAEAWLRAVRDLESRKLDPTFQEGLRVSRDLLRKKHGMLPGTGDWLETLGWSGEGEESA
jgi:glycosyltransferase involved in cell wall biosynthesis